MNKFEVIDKIAENTDLPKGLVSKVIENLLCVIADCMKRREAVSFRGFGKFEAVSRAARKARNPHTKEEVEVPAKIVPHFTPGETIKKETE